MRAHSFFAGIALVLCALVNTGIGQDVVIGDHFVYQAVLKSSGSPFNGTADLVFRCYDQPSGGNLLSEDTASGVSITKGLINVELDFGSGVFKGSKRWLEIEVNGNTLLPRQEIAPAPHALYALASGSVQAAGLPDGGNWSLATALSFDNGTLHIDPVNNRVGIGTVAPVFPLQVVASGSAAIAGSNSGPSGYGVWGESTGTEGYGVYGRASATSGSAFGVVGQSDSSVGLGMYGIAISTSGVNSGVFGQSLSDMGRGVYGWASASSGTNYGVYGHTNSANGYAGYFSGGRNYFGGNVGIGAAAPSARLEVDVPIVGDGINVRGYAPSFYLSDAVNTPRVVLGYAGAAGLYSTSAAAGDSVLRASTGKLHLQTGALNSAITIDNNKVGMGTSAPTARLDVVDTVAGVKATASLNVGRAVTGISSYNGLSGSIGSTSGIYGESYCTFGSGVVGKGTATLAIANGGYFEGVAPQGRGVYAIGTEYGVLGASPGGIAIYASGSFAASGSKSFRIDHPVSPTEKYLLHYCAESPEVINFYSGKVTLDNLGQAIVELPDYFAGINRDPRYTLTPIGAPMPNLHVVTEIDDLALQIGEVAEPGIRLPVCWFRIGGGAPDAKVSWRVEAVRNDRWIQQRGAPVEVEKNEYERGTYQHPELYVQQTIPVDRTLELP